jgi:polysaccharide deacetylase family protein (PEP-CTERM system associated)
MKQVEALPTRETPDVFSIDVEDWYHIMEIESAPPLNEWASMPSMVERNFRTLLDLLDEQQAKATCFFLGWVAERHPELVREAANRGHEVASHGYSHDLVYTLEAGEFAADVSRAKALLEDITGQSVIGYRAPGFSVNENTPWFFDELAKAGYLYDSSVFPAARQHGGGFSRFGTGPCVVHTAYGPLTEFPVSVAKLLGRQMCFFGGGYLRLFPYSVIERMARQVRREGRPLIFYIHPREIDPSHPRLKMPLVRRFKSYIGLAGTPSKIRRILSAQKFQTFSNLLRLYD